MKKKQIGNLTVFNTGKRYIPIPDKKEEINLTRDIVSVRAQTVLAVNQDTVAVSTSNLFCNRDVYIRKLHVFPRKTVAATGIPVVNIDYSILFSTFQFNINGVSGTSVNPAPTNGRISGNGASNNQHEINLFALANTAFGFSATMYLAGVVADIYDLEILIEFEA